MGVSQKFFYKFLHALENDHVSLAHPHWGQGSLWQFFQRGLRNWLKFQQVRAYNFGGSGSSPAILCHKTKLKVGMITYVQFFLGGELAPQKFGRAKKSKIRPKFGQLSNLIANILVTYRDIKNREHTWSTYISVGFSKKLANFGLQTKKLQVWMLFKICSKIKFKIWRDFGQLQTLTANISGADRLTENR